MLGEISGGPQLDPHDAERREWLFQSCRNTFPVSLMLVYFIILYLSLCIFYYYSLLLHYNNKPHLINTISTWSINRIVKWKPLKPFIHTFNVTVYKFTKKYKSS